jgi:sRNA-binding protein
MAYRNVDRLEAEILPVLVKSFPKAFFARRVSCRPPRVGIFGDLDAVLPSEIDRPSLKLYLAIYTRQPHYLRSLTRGAVRIGLNGKEAGKVSAKEAASAAARLKKLHAMKVGEQVPKATAASGPAPGPLISPVPPPVTAPPAWAVKPPRAPSLCTLEEALRRKTPAQAKQQKVPVVVKRRRFPPSGQASQRI